MTDFTDAEVDVIKSLIRDHGVEYGFETKTNDLVALARKLGMKTDWDDLVTHA